MAEPSLPTIKRLFAMSGNACAFPGCQVPIVEKSGVVTGEISHIKAQGVNGPRYNPEQTDEQRHSYENLILLCRRHHKIVDDEVDLYDVDALKEMKSLHEARAGRNEIDQDSFFARILLNDLKRISITNNTGNVMIDSPGAIQGDTINIKTSRGKVSVNAPLGSIGHNVNFSGYIQHLIERYNEYAGSDSARKGKFSYGAIAKNIADNFGTQWKLLTVEKASDVIAYLQQRISRTRQARINKAKGWKAFSTFEEYLNKNSKKSR